ncbi:hypothetical protein OV142_33500 [Nannocystis sp. SCPEA4]|nr:hypothetical protein [Nannocystis sp. SCPEA4]MCY1060050.1 hypothetical protein [Nannocystis sp. SCPEA4]
MNSGRLEQAEQRRVQMDRVRTLVANLRALLAGHMTRAEMSTWLRELWPAGSGQGRPFERQPAVSVYDSLLGLDATWAEHALVREVDLRAYLRWLTEGECFHADDDALFVLGRDIDGLASQLGTEPIRWWYDGLGWLTSLQFCSPASGRPYVVHADLERPMGLGFLAQRGVDRVAAISDLFEVLAIDDGDVSRIHPEIQPARLPAWALMRQDDNGNAFELARFRSHAKACAQEHVFTARGHRQLYWVEPA